jgi:hypothetical protein
LTVALNRIPVLGTGEFHDVAGRCRLTILRPAITGALAIGR